MSDAAERGFTLLEMVCVLAIIALLAAVLLPFMPRETSRSRLQAYALQAATLLKADRDAAISRNISVATLVDAGGRAIRSGASRASIRIPDDVRFDAVLPASRGAVDHPLFRQRDVVRRQHRADPVRCEL
jgi:general secretion pathway protein H